MDSSNMIASAFSDEINVVEGIMGDVDRNGIIAAKDARIVLRHYARLEIMDELSVALADVNNDNNVTAADARLILRCSAKLEIF